MRGVELRAPSKRVCLETVHHPSSSRTSNWEDSASICRVVYPNPKYRQAPTQTKVERITPKMEFLFPIMNCARTCPKNLNPAKAIAEIKKMMVEKNSRIKQK